MAQIVINLHHVQDGAHGNLSMDISSSADSDDSEFTKHISIALRDVLGKSALPAMMPDVMKTAAIHAGITIGNFQEPIVTKHKLTKQ